MKVYFFEYSRIVRKLAWVVGLFLALTLLYKFVQYNFLSTVSTQFKPIYQGDNGKNRLL